MPKNHQGKRNPETVARKMNRGRKKEGLNPDLFASISATFVLNASFKAASVEVEMNQIAGTTSTDESARTLIQAPDASRLTVKVPLFTKKLKPGLATVMRKFVDIVKPNVQVEMQNIFNQMQVAELKYPQQDGCTMDALHLGIWEKLKKKPKISREAWEIQNATVRELMARLCTVISNKVAPLMVSIMVFYYPEIWEQQQRILNHVRQELAIDFEEKPWLDFKGAFFAILIKEGSSEISHLGSNDPKGLTWVAPVGDWERGDLKTPEIGLQTTLGPGEAILTNMKDIVDASPAPTLPAEGTRIILTGYTCSFLVKQSG
ncbi:hypothetical protein C8R42DRAFT_771968 [Lentinula raphanica]|nr:hypothetical protein C8R42DRAFT_771968 [Lentinula raphanica]